MAIEERTTAEITLRWPDAARILEAHGIDTAKAGAQTLQEAAAAQGVSTGQVVRELEAIGITEETPAHAEVIVDVREMPPRERHPRIFATFDGLPIGGALTLVNDHDPKPLFYQFQAERPGQITWEPQEEGPERWVIRIARVA